MLHWMVSRQCAKLNKKNPDVYNRLAHAYHTIIGCRIFLKIHRLFAWHTLNEVSIFWDAWSKILGFFLSFKPKFNNVEFKNTLNVFFQR